MAARIGPISDITSMASGDRAREAGPLAEAERGGSVHGREGLASAAVSSLATSRMRVLAHVHTFNDADIIDATIDALQKQNRPLDAILVVDNASSDATLQQPSLK